MGAGTPIANAARAVDWPWDPFVRGRMLGDPTSEILSGWA